MKNFNRALCAIFAFVVAFTMGACTDPGLDASGTSYDVVVDQPTPMGAKLIVTTKGIKEFAYIQSEGDLPAAAILKGGKVVEVANTASTAKTNVEIDGLQPNTAYTYWFAFHGADGTVITKTKKVTFTTTSYGETLTVTERNTHGIAIHVQIPEVVKERKNGLRYAYTSMPMYNYVKEFMRSIEPMMLLNNAQQFTDTDKLVIYDEEHNYERDEDGNIIETGAEYANPLVPGEPGYFLIGEYAWMEDKEERIVIVDGEVKSVNDLSYWDQTIWTYPAGWDPGYYNPLYDWISYVNDYGTENYDTEKYWTGYYERLFVETIHPEIGGKVDIKVTNVTPIDACISFTPSEDIVKYNVLVCTESEYQTQMLPLIEGKEEYMRWFTGSFFAYNTFGCYPVIGNSELWLSEWFIDTKGLAGQEVRVFVAGLGNDEGTKQSFDTFKFTIPEVTLPRPEVVVTPKDSGDPYKVVFNIKNPNPENVITEAYFACNYVREFNAALGDMTYTEFLKSIISAANAFDASDIEKINSAEGFDFEVSSRDNATTRLAVLAYNWEGTSNNLDAANSEAVAEVTTDIANYPTRVNHELFTKLAGEWVATAPMATVTAATDAEGNYTGEYDYASAGTYNSDVTIFSGAGLPYEETIPEEVYKIFADAGVSRDETDEYYEEFIEYTKWYNERTRGYNRLLCLGFNFTDPQYNLARVETPYGLFTATDYSASKTEYLFYDFGPKWNLEIDEDGSVWLPINVEREYPLSAFMYELGKAFYIMGVHNGTVISRDIRFPVEVSEDYNTITIKPYVYSDNDDTTEDILFYPTVTIVENGYVQSLNPRINGNIVLKRKAAATAAKSNHSVGHAATSVRSANGEAVKPLARSKYSMTSMDPEDITPINRIVLENKIDPSTEAFHERATKCIKAYYGLE